MSWNNKEEIETTCTVQQWRCRGQFLNNGFKLVQELDSRKEKTIKITCTPGCSQNRGTEPLVCTYDVTSLSRMITCSVSTKLATWPSSLQPRTLNLKHEKQYRIIQEYLFLLYVYVWFILIVCLCMATLTEVFPCFFLSCKANARVKPAKTGHGLHSS